MLCLLNYLIIFRNIINCIFMNCIVIVLKIDYRWFISVIDWSNLQLASTSNLYRDNHSIDNFSIKSIIHHSLIFTVWLFGLGFSVETAHKETAGVSIINNYYSARD